MYLVGVLVNNREGPYSVCDSLTSNVIWIQSVLENTSGGHGKGRKKMVMHVKLAVAETRFYNRWYKLVEL